MKYPSIDELDPGKRKHQIFECEEVYVFEKLDGGNVQVVVPERGIITHGLRSGKSNRRSRAGDSADEFEKFFWSNRHRFLDSLEPGFAYFMEFMSPHSIDYRDEFVNRPFLIDVYNLKERRFVPYESAVAKIKSVSDIILHTKPRHLKHVDRKMIPDLVSQKSPYSVDGVMEGVVLKSYMDQTFVKVYHPDHRPKKE